MKDILRGVIAIIVIAAFFFFVLPIVMFPYFTKKCQTLYTDE